MVSINGGILKTDTYICIEPEFFFFTEKKEFEIIGGARFSIHTVLRSMID